VGRDALFFPGRTFSREELKGLLPSLSLEDVQVSRWQESYDLVWAKKRGSPGEEPPKNLLEVLLCPRCGSSLARRSEAMGCPNCDHFYPFVDGVLSLEV
jgi:rubrerythrin